MRTFIFLVFTFSSLISSAQSFTFVFLNSRTDKAELPKEELDKLMEGHLKNIGRLAKEGKLIVAGPFDGGGGIFIMNTPSIDVANEWLGTDPGIQANRWRLEVLPYYPVIGSACPSKEPYEMVTYSFIRFTPNIHKDNVSAYDELALKHDQYIKQLANAERVITIGQFGSREGGILVLEGDVNTGLIENDPGVQRGVLLAEIKKVWVAKGSFCEEK